MGCENMSSSEPYISVKDIHKSFAQTEVLKGISFDIAKGEAVCIIGPSGSGKSTLLRCINQLEKIDRGAISVDGELIGYRRAGDEHRRGVVAARDGLRGTSEAADFLTEAGGAGRKSRTMRRWSLPVQGH